MLKNLHKRSYVLVLILITLLTVSAFSQEVVASIDIPLTTYFARVQPNQSIQIVDRALVWFGENNLKGTEYEHLPLLSSQSTVNGGFRGPEDFLNIPAGNLTQSDIAKIYRYNNTIQALKLNGKQIIEWLEASAGNFFQIDPNKTEDQQLVDYGFDCHHFDHFFGITYMFDVTQPLGKRVVRAEYNGKPLTEDMEFIILTDNYRASGGGGLPNAVPENVVMKWDTNMRSLIIDYLNYLNGKVLPLIINWSIKPIETKGRILFKTGAEWGIPVVEYMEIAAKENIEPIDHIEYVGTDDVWGLFKIDLSKVRTPYDQK